MDVSAGFSLIAALITYSPLRYLWGWVNFSQLIAMVPLIDVPLPPNLIILYRFRKIANGEFYFWSFLPNIYEEKNLVNYSALSTQPPLNSNFDFCGYDSGSFFLLQQGNFVYYFYYFSFLVPVMILSLILRKATRW